MKRQRKNKISLIYVTCPDIKTAKKLSKLLLEKRLIACANILPGMQSLYRWQGKMESAREVVLILKTRAKFYAAVEKLILKEHPYDCPCVMEILVSRMAATYQDWLVSGAD